MPWYRLLHLAVFSGYVSGDFRRHARTPAFAKDVEPGFVYGARPRLKVASPPAHRLTIIDRQSSRRNDLTKRKDSMPTSISPIADYGLVEHIMDQGRPLAYIIRESFQPEKTTFLTPPEFRQQVG